MSTIRLFLGGGWVRDETMASLHQMRSTLNSSDPCAWTATLGFVNDLRAALLEKFETVKYEVPILIISTMN